jgi:hypothetical protein
MRKTAEILDRSLSVEFCIPRFEYYSGHGGCCGSRDSDDRIRIFSPRGNFRRCGAQAPIASEPDRTNRRRPNCGIRRASSRALGETKNIVQIRRSAGPRRSIASAGFLQLRDFWRHLSHCAGHYWSGRPDPFRTAGSRATRQHQVRSLKPQRFHSRCGRLVRLTLADANSPTLVTLSPNGIARASNEPLELFLFA